MRKFIISDIHGFGNVYYSIIKYLDKLSENEEIELYINGDLIDRGFESAEILLDVKKRIEDNKFKIHYLGGNHELMMYEVFEKREKGKRVSFLDDWFNNGGYYTDWGLDDLGLSKKDRTEIFKLISNLKIYHKFNEKIGDKPIVLVHASCPEIVRDECNMRIKDNNGKVFYSTWTREHNGFNFMGVMIPVPPFSQRIGNNKYFTIIGHEPVNNKYGFEYHDKQNYLNIDGGCAAYVSGYFDYDHFPLVEVCNGYLKILTFNNNNEIIYGNYFNGKDTVPFKDMELEEARKYLDNSVKIKKISINKDREVGYWD